MGIPFMSMAEGGTRIAKLELGTITFKVFGSTQKNNHEQRKDRTVIEHVGVPSSQSEGVVAPATESRAANHNTSLGIPGRHSIATR
jgi:hypothetical protein